MAERRRIGWAPWIVVLALVGGAFAVSRSGWLDSEDPVAFEGVPVARGDLRISEPVKGNLEARNSVRLRSELERQSTILFLIEEGTMVEAGELVVELDVAELVDRQVDQEGSVESAQASLTKAEENYAIQEIQNETDIAEANLQRRFAEMDLEKYRVEDGEWTNELAEVDESIALAREELAQKQKEYTFTETLVSKDFAPASDLEEAALAKQRAEITLARAERDKRLRVQYAHVRRLEELEEAVRTAEREVTKTEKQAVARLADLEASKNQAAKQLEREQEKLVKLIDQISKGRIYAPEAGMVVYARQRGRWGDGDPMDEGVNVRERQDIITIPRPGGMVAEATLHETSLRKVRPGLRCIVRVDAMPGQVFEGEVTHVAVLPDSNGWMQDPNQRTYQSEITLTKGTLEMRPGMSCSIEILIEDQFDVLYVPKQCVFLEGRETVAYVKRDGEVERRVVVTGPDNRNHVVVREGLNEGELVLLTRPASFQPQEGDGAGLLDGEGAPLPEPTGNGEVGSGRPSGRPGGGPSGGGSGWSGRSGGKGAGAARGGGSRGGETGGEGRGRPEGAGRPEGSRRRGGAPQGGTGRPAKDAGGGGGAADAEGTTKEAGASQAAGGAGA